MQSAWLGRSAPADDVASLRGKQGVVASTDCPPVRCPHFVEELNAGALKYEPPPVFSHALQLAHDLAGAQVGVLRLNLNECPGAAYRVGRHD
jgi:hypothetical protein